MEAADAEPDPVLELLHDHDDLNQLVRDVGDLVRGGNPDDATPALVAQLKELREHLFLHFAREEEGVFPYVGAGFPELGDDIASMVNAHDTVCGAVARMVHAAQTRDHGLLPVLFDRFETSYTLHARAERALLQRIAERLSPGNRAELIDLLRRL